MMEVEGAEIAVKARPDYLHQGNGDIIDLKTTRDSAFAAFPRQAYEYQYHLSAAFYRDVVDLELGKKDRHVWYIALEKECPFDVCVYRANDMMLDRGEADYRKAIWRYLEARKTGVWPGKQQAAQDLDLPNYAQYE